MFPEIVSQDGPSWRQVQAAQPVGGTAGLERGLGSALPACLTAVSLAVAGTLTQNEMVFKRLHLGTVSYGADTVDEVQRHVRDCCSQVRARLRRRPCSPGFLSELLAKTIP